MSVKFVSLDKVARTATLDVDGTKITRKIPEKFEGTIDDYLTALARGLQIEADKEKAEAKVIDTPTIKANAEIISNNEA